MNSPDAEREELERAIELLGRNTRPGRLLGYVGEKYLQQQQEQLTEFNIATEVFGRSTDSFDAGEDAVVRVEAHRLRKKLREIYEKGGGKHGLQISLPAGTYVPQFSCALEARLEHEPSERVTRAQVAAVTTSSDPAVERDTDAPRRVSKWALYFSLAIGILCVAIFGALKLKEATDTQGRSSPPPQARSASPAGAASDNISEVHLMAGYSGSEVIDNSGVRWTPDRFFTGGGTWPRAGGFVRRTSRPFLFANWRNGEFSYDIPLQPGIYELRLFFVSPLSIGDEKLLGFNVSLGGKPLLTGFDVNMDAQGTEVADERLFRDVSPDDDGFVHLRFSNQIATPWLNALEIVPGIPHKQIPIRIITQPTSFVDHKGQRWRADDYFLNGFRSTERRIVTGTEDPELFAAERYGYFSYAIPVDTRGRYTVVLHFTEFFFGPRLPGGGGVGSRIFHVFCNGNTLLENFDVYKEGGSLRVVTRTFANIKPSPQGKINLTFEPVVNNATVSGIEVIDESE
jgi:hypothetical protein